MATCGDHLNAPAATPAFLGNLPENFSRFQTATPVRRGFCDLVLRCVVVEQPSVSFWHRGDITAYRLRETSHLPPGDSFETSSIFGGEAMRGNWRQWVAAGLLAIGNPAAVMADQEIHVSLQGDDTGTGTLESPLKTLAAARDLARLRRQTADPSESFRIVIHGGEYHLPTALTLTAEDSGTAEGPTTWTAATGETVRLSGGAVVRQFASLEIANCPEELVEAARTQVLVADLTTAGISDCGTWGRRGSHLPTQPAPVEVFQDGVPLPVSCWPNAGWARVEQVLEGGRVVTSADAPLRTTRGWAHGYWEAPWRDSLESFETDANTARDESANRTSTLVLAADSGCTPRVGAKFRVVNALAELDQPGEWYVDGATKRLYLWPAKGDVATQIVVSRLDTVLSLYGVENVRFENLTIETARVMGVEIAGGTDVQLNHCQIRNTGTLGVHVFHGDSHRVAHCEISHTGEGGIRVEGGDRESLTPAQHLIEHNHIHHYSRAGMAYRPAVNVFGVGVQVVNNLIHDGPHAAILLQGNDHAVDRNHIHHVCLETDDVGAIYLAHNPTFRGNHIRHNYLHDLGGEGATAVVGIYLDDFASGTEVFGNAIQRVPRGVVVGGGRDNLIDNNLLVECLAGIQIDCRGATWAKSRLTPEMGPLDAACREVKATEGIYAERYPELARWRSESPELATGNRVTRNVVQSPHEIVLLEGANPDLVKVEQNLVRTDPQFVSSDRTAEPRLAPTSPAFALGFVDIPWEQIGPDSQPSPEEKLASQ